MKTLKIDLPETIKELELHVIADTHIGDAQSDMKLLQERIEHIRDTKNAYCVLNGDILNNATKTSVSDIYSETLSPMQSVNKAKEMFMPIHDKILYINSGNHEQRTYQKEGIDLLQLFAIEMNLADKFTPESAVLFIQFGKHNKQNGKNKVRKVCYSIYSLHGRGGGRKEGSKINRLADMAGIVDTDIYIHSHTHLPAVIKENFFRVDIPNAKVNEVTKLFVNSAATLTYGGYGCINEYKPSATDTPVIYLNGTKKEASARL